MMPHWDTNNNINVSNNITRPFLANVLVYSCHHLVSVCQMRLHLDFVLVAYRRHLLWWRSGKVGKPWLATIGIQESRQCLPKQPKMKQLKKLSNQRCEPKLDEMSRSRHKVEGNKVPSYCWLLVALQHPPIWLGLRYGQSGGPKSRLVPFTEGKAYLHASFAIAPASNALTPTWWAARSCGSWLHTWRVWHGIKVTDSEKQSATLS